MPGFFSSVHKVAFVFQFHHDAYVYIDAYEGNGAYAAGDTVIKLASIIAITTNPATGNQLVAGNFIVGL